MKINDRILNYDISKQLPKPAQDAAGKVDGQQVSQSQKSGETNGTGQDAVVNLSTASKEVQMAREVISSIPDVREEKVAEIKEKIESGNYRVDHEGVAAKLIEAFTEDIF